MSFDTVRNIDSAFRFVRLFAFLLLICCFISSQYVDLVFKFSG